MIWNTTFIFCFTLELLHGLQWEAERHSLLGYGGILFADNIWTAAASYVMIVFTVNYLRTMMAPMGALIIDND